MPTRLQNLRRHAPRRPSPFLLSLPLAPCSPSPVDHATVMVGRVGVRWVVRSVGQYRFGYHDPTPPVFEDASSPATPDRWSPRMCVTRHAVQTARSVIRRGFLPYPLQS